MSYSASASQLASSSLQMSQLLYVQTKQWHLSVLDWWNDWTVNGFKHKKKQLYLWGPSNSGKTTFINNLLARCINGVDETDEHAYESQVFTPIPNEKRFAWQEFDSKQHSQRVESKRKRARTDRKQNNQNLPRQHRQLERPARGRPKMPQQIPNNRLGHHQRNDRLQASSAKLWISAHHRLQLLLVLGLFHSVFVLGQSRYGKWSQQLKRNIFAQHNRYLFYVLPIF